MEEIGTENIDLKLKLITEFQKFEESLNGEANTYLHKIRQDAIASFNELGFPVKKLEEWKYTNINPILTHNFKQSFSDYTATLEITDIEQFLVKNSGINLLVFINGRFENSLSNIITKNENSFIGNFLEGKSKYKEIVEKHFSRYADYKNSGLTALNTAFSKDGAFIYAGKDIEIMDPIHILNISDGRDHTYLSQPRNLIIAEEGSKLSVIDDFHSIGDKHSFTNAVTEVYCNSNSNVEHYKIQNFGSQAYYVGTTQVFQEKDSRFSDTTISWGGSIIRNNLNSFFNGMNTECHFFGLYMLSGKQHVDNHTLADHASPHCYSNELYKGILDDKSTGVFNGKILVRADAQKTNAYQSNNNILLSDDATIYSKPQLEIFADDVKCSHGATSGQLSNEEMFYLRSRGIGEDDARTLLLYAYASDVLDSVKINELREMLVKKLEMKLKKEI